MIQSEITRSDARKKGQKRYFTGCSCKHGHVCERLVSNAGCIECLNSRKLLFMRQWRMNPDIRERYRLQESDRYSRDEVRERVRERNAAPSVRERRQSVIKRWRTDPIVRSKLDLYEKEYKPRRYENERQRLQTDPNFKLIKLLRSRIRVALKGQQRSKSSIALLGCSLEEARAYIEAKFQSGMSWKNWAIDGWHLDHRKPLASFDLTDPEQLAAACHYTNLQPLWAEDNLRKSSKLNLHLNSAQPSAG